MNSAEIRLANGGTMAVQVSDYSGDDMSAKCWRAARFVGRNVALVAGVALTALGLAAGVATLFECPPLAIAAGCAGLVAIGTGVAYQFVPNESFIKTILGGVTEVLLNVIAAPIIPGLFLLHVGGILDGDLFVEGMREPFLRFIPSDVSAHFNRRGSIL